MFSPLPLHSVFHPVHGTRRISPSEAEEMEECYVEPEQLELDLPDMTPPMPLWMRLLIWSFIFIAGCITFASLF